MLSSMEPLALLVSEESACYHVLLIFKHIIVKLQLSISYNK